MFEIRLLTSITWCDMGMRPKSRVAFVGPHSPLAQSGNGTMTVCNSSQIILNLHTLLNFIGSPVKYSLGVTELANMSNRKAPLLGACTRNDTMFPSTDLNRINTNRNHNYFCYFTVPTCNLIFMGYIIYVEDGNAILRLADEKNHINIFEFKPRRDFSPLSENVWS